MGDANRFPGARVLIVDDEAIQRALTRDALEDAGFEVVEAVDGEEALAHIDELNPDLVLLDVIMPNIDGYEVCRRLRSREATAQLPIVIVTGRESPEDINEGMAAGASDFLTKPVNWDLLPNRVRFVLRAAKLERELRASRDQARAADEAKTRFLANMSHELRTPLNAIIGFSELLKLQMGQEDANPNWIDYVTDVHASGTHLLGIINDILEISKIDAGSVDLNRDLVSATELFEFCRKSVSAIAKSQNQSLICEVDPGLGEIICDKRLIRQALLNLLSNAVKFTGDGGQIETAISADSQGRVHITVTDDGIGMTSHEVEICMQPFGQADSTLSRRFEGTGLGLPLVKRYSELHGGELRVSSKKGSGTTATIVLPPGSHVSPSRRPADDHEREPAMVVQSG